MIFTDQIAIHIKRLPRYASLLLLLLVLLHTARVLIDFGTDWQYGGGSGGENQAGPFFDIVNERTALAWLSSSMMLVAALGCLLCLHVLTEHKYQKYWRVLAGIMFYLSIDESVSIHERLTAPIQRSADMGGALLWAWVIPGAIFAGVVGLSAIPFLKSIPPTAARRMFFGGAIFITGAVGFEMVGAAITDAGYFEGVWYTVVASIEETLEALGMILFLSAISWLLTSDNSPRKSDQEILAT